MQKNLIIPIVILLILLGAGAIFVMRPDSSTPGTSGDEIISGNSSTEESLTTSLADLIKLGRNYVCTFTHTDESGTSTAGEVYVSGAGNKVSGEFTSVSAQAPTIASNFLSDGEYSYMWSSDTKQGFKTKIVDVESMFDSNQSTPESNSSEAALGESYDYNCKAWVVDESRFVPPADVEFTDFSAITESINEQLNNIPNMPDGVDAGNLPGANSCAACEYLPDADAKAQCRQAMGC